MSRRERSNPFAAALGPMVIRGSSLSSIVEASGGARTPCNAGARQLDVVMTPHVEVTRL